MNLWRRTNGALEGAPDRTLTGLLLLVAFVLVVVAFSETPALKALVAAWVIAP